MATEKRLIDAYALIGKALEEKRFVFQKEDLLNHQIVVNTVYGDLGEFILSSPVVDAVEVVRCKDCKKWFRHTQVDRERGDCRRYQTTKHELGFCDRGERKDNAKNN